MTPRLAVGTGNERRNRLSTRKQDLGSHTKERDGVRSSTSGGGSGCTRSSVMSKARYLDSKPDGLSKGTYNSLVLISIKPTHPW